MAAEEARQTAAARAQAADAAARRAWLLGAAARTLLAFWRALLLEAFGPFTRELAPRVAPARLARDAALLHRRVPVRDDVLLELLDDLQKGGAIKPLARPQDELRACGGSARNSGSVAAVVESYLAHFRRLGAAGVNAGAVGGSLALLGEAVGFGLVATYGDFVGAVYLTASAAAEAAARLPDNHRARRLAAAAADLPARFREQWHRYSVVLADLVLVADAEAGYANDAAGAAAAAAAEAGEMARFATGVFGACRPVLDERFK
jgi:hypothetical protein